MTADKSQLAPSYSLDLPSYISIEYPLRVKNNEKAIQMIGGNENISKCFIEPDKVLQLRLRPDDPYSHPVDATRLISNENLLLKVSIPKKVLLRNNRNIQKSIEDCELNGIKYKVESEANMCQTHKFRDLADFQIIKPESEFVNKFQKSVYKGDLQNIQSFADYIESDFAKKQVFNDEDLDLPPLVRYARVDVPFNYKYMGQLVVDEHGHFRNKRIKLRTIFSEWGKPVPTEYDPPLNTNLEKAKKEIEKMKADNLERLIPNAPAFCFLECIRLVTKLFTLKPVWIRRHIYWMIPAKYRSQLRFALPYVAYTTKTGPWRQSFVNYEKNERGRH
ncbi:unnamed protein product [Ambrosiozyma monospora]|uniref:Unnamed protein product n=1 Tax=Ambrosiozyma monospora TaxID=43982 RepID=A0ACB5TCY5_AMBMO|nr:unnamed protein product [Ambrosiozyma monospora]